VVAEQSNRSIRVNGRNRTVRSSGDTPLLWVLREELELAGAKYGCGQGLCGSCTVHLDGAPVRSCQLPLRAVGAAPVTTIEGLSEDGNHPVQEAGIHEDVAQCGYCQTGQIMTVVALLDRNPDPTDAEIEAALAGNLCRCGTYVRIRRAIARAAGRDTPREANDRG